jgi:hypothetical protein
VGGQIFKFTAETKRRKEKRGEETPSGHRRANGLGLTAAYSEELEVLMSTQGSGAGSRACKAEDGKWHTFLFSLIFLNFQFIFSLFLILKILKNTTLIWATMMDNNLSEENLATFLISRGKIRET